MNKKQMDLLMKRCIFEPQKYSGVEPISIKKKKDIMFCLEFFGKKEVDNSLVKSLLTAAIMNKNEYEFDLLLMLLEHFNITKNYDLILAELLIQPWHHFHDRIAGILEFDKNEGIIDYLYQGALFSCDNLEYESDYCGFNRKCLYALARIGTKEAIEYIKKVSTSNNIIVSEYAKNILVKYNYTV